jgi:hypothetical protein
MRTHALGWLLAVLLAAFLLCPGALAETPSDAAAPTASKIDWLGDYHAALDEAEQHGRMALVWFVDRGDALTNVRFERDVLSQPEIQAAIGSTLIPVKLPTDAVVASGGQEIKLLDHPAFAEMLHSPGLAIIDMTEPAGPLYRQVVSVYPFRRGPISADKLQVLLDLPRGTLTQRTLIFAVRTHGELPASTLGQLSPILTRETENHAWHQARITLQGHHNWDSRFHAINAELPGGLLAREVCAESWPGQTLVEAAEECVHSWRQSPGHWDAVRTQHPLFGYDMKRGVNGVWYAVGIFASR